MVGAECTPLTITSGGEYVTQDACRRAHRNVIDDLCVEAGGFKGNPHNHLDPATGWLSVDVINVLGAAICDLHVEGERPLSLEAFCASGTSAVFLNRNGSPLASVGALC